MGRRLYLLALFLLLCAAAPPAEAAKRVALVIGNDDYAQVADLQKAVNDARAMGEALRSIGFDVLSVENVTRREMNRHLQLFSSRLEAGDEALFFYAGHGVEISGRNFLLPTDIPGAQPGQETFVQAEAVPVDHVLDAIRGRGVRVSILVLDACRDNPFPKAGTRSLGAARGLARMPAPEGTFIIYSAGVGQTALDRLSDTDPNPNSVFTRSLIPLIKQPGVSLVQAARDVRREVQRLAATVSHDQRPAYYDEVTGEFFFAGRGAGASGAAAKEDEDGKLAALQQELERLKQQVEKAPEEPRTATESKSSPFEEFFQKFFGNQQEKPKDEMKVAIGSFPDKTAAESVVKPGDEFQDCDVCPRMVVVPAGSFLMGSPASEPERDNSEGPQRTVTIARPFAIGKFEVTFAEWDACVADGGCNGYQPKDHGWGRGTQPVINVRWAEAKAYVAWLSKKTGMAYRLPSEAEWEYAARAGTATPFSTGRTITADQANFEGNRNGSSVVLVRGQTMPVGSFAANAFRLHDMHGNVMEFVEDCWNDSYAGAPADGSAWSRDYCPRRVMRGGGWGSSAKNVRSAARYSFSGGSDGGFRVARTLN